MIRIDFAPKLTELRKEFSQLTDAKFNLAINRALNHVANKAKTSAAKEIRKVYDIPAKDIKKDLVVKRSTPTILVAQINSAGKPLPLSAFKPRAVRKGISVKIGKSRQTVPGAFFGKISGQSKGGEDYSHEGVFARGGYEGKKFKFADERLPINELFSKSIPRALVHDTVIASLMRQVEADLPDRARHEIAYLLSSKGASTSPLPEDAAGSIPLPARFGGGNSGAVGRFLGG